MIHRLRVTWQSRQSSTNIKTRAQFTPKVNVVRKVQNKTTQAAPLQIQALRPAIRPLSANPQRNPQRIEVHRTNVNPIPRAIVKPLANQAKVPLGPSPIKKKALERGNPLHVGVSSKPNIRQTVSAKSGNVSDVKITSLRGIGAGRILIMIAAGPSVNEVDFIQIKNHPQIDIMCINQPNQQVWPTKYWSFCDHTQYRRNVSIWEAYQGVTINSPNVKAKRSKQIMIKNRPGKGFCLDIVHGYHVGRSSTYASMQVAYYMNYDRVYLFGVDMCAVGGKMHYYGQNPDVSNEVRQTRFAAEAESYTWASKNLPEEIRKRFWFCSSYNPWDFVNCFNKLDHKIAIDEILKTIS